MTHSVKATSKVTKAAAICGAALCLASLAGCKPAAPSRALLTAAEESPEPRIATDDPADAPALSPEQVPAIPSSPDPVAPIEPVEPLASLAQRYFGSADPESRVELIGQIADRQDAAAVGVLGWLFRTERDTDLKLSLLAAVMMQEDYPAEQAAVFAGGLWTAQPQSVRAMAVEGLAALRTPAAIHLLHGLRFDADQEIRDAVAEALSPIAP